MILEHHRCFAGHKWYFAAEDFRYEATDSMNEQYKRTALESDIYRQTDSKDELGTDRILVVTPLGPAKELSENNRLTPDYGRQGFTRVYCHQVLPNERESLQTWISVLPYSVAIKFLVMGDNWLKGIFDHEVWESELL